MRSGAVLAATLGVFCYLGTLAADFVYDDYPYVVENADLRGGIARLPRLYTSSFPSQSPERGLYRPVTAASYLFDRVGGDVVAWRHHATNLALWGLLVFTVHGSLRRLLPPHAATAGAVLFAVHPVHVKRRREVQAQDRFMEAWRGRGRVGRRGTAGVVDEDVEPAQACGDGRDEPIDLLRVSHVRSFEDGAAPAGARQRFGNVSAADRDLGAGGQEAFADPAPDAAGAAGDEYDLAGEVERVAHASSPISWATRSRCSKLGSPSRLALGRGRA